MRILPLLAAVLCFLALTNESLVAPLTQSPFLNIWKPMSAEEIRQTTCWLFSQPDLNLNRATSHGSWHNSMYVLRQPSTWRRLGYSERLLMLCVESQSIFFAPTRQDALAYLSGLGSQRPPPRYAHAVLSIRATAEPYYHDILGGPLSESVPVSLLEMTWKSLEYPLTRKTSGIIRNLNADKDGSLQA